MLESIQFENFKILRQATLPLGPFTLIVGPNGAGKSTALQALRAANEPGTVPFNSVVHAGGRGDQQTHVAIRFLFASESRVHRLEMRASPGSGWQLVGGDRSGMPVPDNHVSRARSALGGARIYAFDASTIAAPVALLPRFQLASNGHGLAVVLDRLRDQHPERFEHLNAQVAGWLPEFDRILFDTPREGHRSISLRLATNQESIAASELSQGTLLALAMLTLAYLPDPPPLVGFEEPDRGLHPRLLRDVRDAMYRLAYPKEFGETRAPVQVIATTHSPYFLDLFRDRPEEIVIAEKTDDGARFVKLTDLPNIDEILRDSHLGEVWYSGILGGVPANR